MESVLASHIEQTRRRTAGHRRVLAIQDTTNLDFSSHRAKKGMGPIATAGETKGLLMHCVLMLSEGKTPLGIAGLQLWAREEGAGTAKERRSRAVGDKESSKWLVGLGQAQEAADKSCELVVIGDRESDIYALFAVARREGSHLLVRMAQDRAVEDEEHRYLSEAINALPVAGSYEVDVPRHRGHRGRKATLEIRFGSVVLRAPRHRTPDVSGEPIRVWVVEAAEREVPEGEDAIVWRLLTTEVIESLDLAIRAVREYASRWSVEEFHRVIKSGCQVERMQFESAESLTPAIAVNAVVAWRILHLTKLARESPETDAREVALPEEITVLERWLSAMKEKKRTIQSAHDFVRAVALLGGFMGRRGDGEPGTKVLWQGLKRLEDLLIGYRLAAGLDM